MTGGGRQPRPAWRTRLAAIRQNVLGGRSRAEVNADLMAAGILTVGPHTYGDPLLLLFSRSADDLARDGGRVRIGDYCSIGGDVEIYTGGNHRVDWVTTYPMRIKFGLPGARRDGHPATRGDVVIGNDVWIGNHVRILSGVTVGDGAVLAASAQVSTDVPPYAVVAGNPARVVRYRFDPAQIEALLEIRWWSWPEAEVVAAVDRLCDPDVDAFITWARSRRTD